MNAISLIDQMGNDQSIIRAARVSLAGDQIPRPIDQDRKLMRYLIQNHHMSPFEHTALTFRIKCPVYVDRHIVRHRIGVAKNEESARYVEVQEEFYVPTKFRQQAKSNRQASVESEFSDYTNALMADMYAHQCTEAIRTYHELLKLGVAREQARGVLPQSMYTSSYYTFNVRSLMHFIDLRDHPGAQWETQDVARKLLAIAETLFPMAFGVYKETRPS